MTKHVLFMKSSKCEYDSQTSCRYTLKRGTEKMYKISSPCMSIELFMQIDNVHSQQQKTRLDDDFMLGSK